LNIYQSKSAPGRAGKPRGGLINNFAADTLTAKHM
jgi:hypothetical protein